MKWIVALWLGLSTGATDGPYTNGELFSTQIECEHAIETAEFKAGASDFLATVNKVLAEDGGRVLAIRVFCTQESVASNP